MSWSSSLIGERSSKMSTGMAAKAMSSASALPTLSVSLSASTRRNGCVHISVIMVNMMSSAIISSSSTGFSGGMAAAAVNSWRPVNGIGSIIAGTAVMSSQPETAAYQLLSARSRRRKLSLSRNRRIAAAAAFWKIPSKPVTISSECQRQP